MADVERSVTIARGPEAVRAFLLDGDSVMRWQPRLEEYEHLPPDRLEVGTRTRGVVVARGRRLEWTAEIVEWDEAGWKWRSLAANPRWQMRWDLEAVAGGTVLTYRQWSPALSHIAAIAWRNRLGRRAERDLERLRLMLEDEDAP